MGKQGPHPASVVAIHPRHNLKYNVLFSVRGRTVSLTLKRRLGNKFLKYNTVGSTGLLTWKRNRLFDWRPMPNPRGPQSFDAQGPAGVSRTLRATGKVAFISYSSMATEDAYWVADAFRGAGAQVWLDESEIAAGSSLPAAIRHGISSADVFVPVVDDAWFGSDWCQRELALARQHHTRVAPIRINHGRLQLDKTAKAALATVGEPLVVDLRGARANAKLIELAQNVLR